MGRPIGSKDKKGPRHFTAKLTNAQRDDIFRKKRKGVTNVDLAAQYDVCPKTMSRAVRELYQTNRHDMEVERRDDNTLKQLLSIPLAEKTIRTVAEKNDVSPLEAAQAWLSVLDKIALAGLDNMRAKHDKKYDGMDELGLGYASSGEYDLNQNAAEDRSWVQSAMAAEDWSAKDLTSVIVAQTKMYMEIMPYYHPKLSAIEPRKKQSDLESLSATDRRKRMHELGKKLGLEITEVE